MDARTKLMLGRGRPTAARVRVPQTTAAPPSPYAEACPVSAKHTTCCGPCEDLGFCRDNANCCLECHFGYEEKLAFPYLPEEGRQILREQHAWLAAHGYPPDEVSVHAEYEMEWFRAYNVPQCVIEQIEADHAEHARGRLLSRDVDVANTVGAPAPIAGASSLAPIPVAGRWVRPLKR